MGCFCCNITTAYFRSLKFTFYIKISTGTRIRTQIKGFGDPYATIAPCPCVCTYKRTQNKKPKEELLTFELSERKDKKPFEIKKSFFRLPVNIAGFLFPCLA